ncbi:GNAT family N-acetyltransferase [soil metagenome]
MAEFTNRAAGEADIPAITEIYAEAVATGSASFEVVPPDESEMTVRMRALVAGGFPYLVAEGSGRVLGYGHAGPYRTRPGYRNTVENSIYLSADARGKGIGGVLLRQLIEESTARGFRQMVAIIGCSDNVASIRLHKAAGFALVGTLKNVGYKHGRWLDSVLMQRELGPGASEPPSR